MLWRLVFAMPMQNFEAIRQFLYTELVKKRENYILHNFVLQFVEDLDHRQKW